MNDQLLTGIPHGLDEIIHTFGDVSDPTFEAQHVVRFELPYSLYYGGQPVATTLAHHLAVPHFVKALSGIKAAGLEHLVKNFSGIYARRPIRGRAAHPSTHSWAIAIDLEAERYPLGSMAKFPDEVIRIWKDAGFFYGGDFKSRKDPMHFQLCTGY
jgi:D-alanyl-D-alanine carboxypeptidase